MDHLPEVCLTHTSRTVVHRGAAAQLRRAHLAYGEGGNVLSLHNPDLVRSRRCAPNNGVMRKVRATRKLHVRNYEMDPNSTATSMDAQLSINPDDCDRQRKPGLSVLIVSVYVIGD